MIQPPKTAGSDKLERDKLRWLDEIRVALYVHGILTDRESANARKRIVKRVAEITATPYTPADKEQR